METRTAFHKRLWDYLGDEEDQGLRPEPQDGGLRPEPGNEDLLEDQDGEENEGDEGNAELDDDGEPEGPDNNYEDFDEESEAEVEYGITDPDPDLPRVIPSFWTDGTEYNREFRSWYDFVESAKDDALYAWRGGGERYHASHKTNDNQWSGTSSFNEAVKMALFTGWPEGRAMLSDSLVAVAPRPKVYANLEFDVAGAFPCVPLYCAGDPACMVQDPGANIRNSKPIIRIDYNHWVHAGVTSKDIMLRGAAILSLADTLERQGYSTELRVIGNSRSDKIFRYSIVYKEAGEVLDLDRAAFAMAHPSSMRRLAFAILEQHKDLESGFNSNYGMPMYEANDPTSGKPGGAIFVPGSRGRETVETANKAVAKAAEALLLAIENGDD